jgi:NADH dehydrogenase
MRVLVTGAAGFLGSYALPLLRKYDTRIFVRREFSFNNFEVFKGDLLNKEDVRRAVKDVDVVVNLAGIAHQKKQKFWDVHVRAVENIVRYSSNLIHISALWASPEGNEYQRSKWWGEQAAKKAESYVIIRPSVMFGVNDSFVNRILKVLRKYPFIPVVKGEVSPVFAGDVANLIAESIEGNTNKIISVCGPRDYKLEELFRIIATIFEIKKPSARIPRFFLSLYSRISELTPEPLLPRIFLSMMETRACDRLPTDLEDFLRRNREFF